MLQTGTLSSTADALAAFAEWILPWQRASPTAGGGAGVAGWGSCGEGEGCAALLPALLLLREGIRLRSCCPAKSIKLTERHSREKRKQAGCQERERNDEPTVQDQPQTTLLHQSDISSFTCLKLMTKANVQALTSSNIFFQPSLAPWLLGTGSRVVGLSRRALCRIFAPHARYFILNLACNMLCI